MVTDDLLPWLAPAGRYALQAFEGDGERTAFEFNFAGGYIDPSDVRAYVYDTVNQGYTTVSPVVLNGPNTLHVIPPVAQKSVLVVYRETQKSQPLADFADGTVLNAANLNKVAQQAVFAAAEMTDRFGAAARLVADAHRAARDAAQDSALDKAAAAAAAGQAAEAAATAGARARTAAESALTAQVAAGRADARLQIVLNMEHIFSGYQTSVSSASGQAVQAAQAAEASAAKAAAASAAAATAATATAAVVMGVTDSAAQAVTTAEQAVRQAELAAADVADKVQTVNGVAVATREYGENLYAAMVEQADRAAAAATEADDAAHTANAARATVATANTSADRAAAAAAQAADSLARVTATVLDVNQILVTDVGKAAETAKSAAADVAASVTRAQSAVEMAQSFVQHTMALAVQIESAAAIMQKGPVGELRDARQFNTTYWTPPDRGIMLTVYVLFERMADESASSMGELALHLYLGNDPPQVVTWHDFAGDGTVTLRLHMPIPPDTKWMFNAVAVPDGYSARALMKTVSWTETTLPADYFTGGIPS